MKKNKKNKNKNKRTLKSVISSTRFLFVVFILLLILVIILGILCYKKDNELKKNKPSNIVIPIVKSDSNIDFSINAVSLSLTRDYVIKITNYDKNKKFNKDINYKLVINNNNDCLIGVYKDDSKVNLMNNQEENIINGSLNGDSKEEIYYHIKMLSKGNLNSKDLVNIVIES